MSEPLEYNLSTFDERVIDLIIELTDLIIKFRQVPIIERSIDENTISFRAKLLKSSPLVQKLAMRYGITDEDLPHLLGHIYSELGPESYDILRTQAINAPKAQSPKKMQKEYLPAEVPTQKEEFAMRMSTRGLVFLYDFEMIKMPREQRICDPGFLESEFDIPFPFIKALSQLLRAKDARHDEEIAGYAFGGLARIKEREDGQELLQVLKHDAGLWERGLLSLRRSVENGNNFNDYGYSR